MVGRTDTSTLFGIDGKQVIVEADYSDGLPAFDMVGLLDSSVREARERVRSALRNTGVMVPPGRLTVSLSPADLRKQGNHFDLAIAISILAAVGIVPAAGLSKYFFVGELSLDGMIRPANGILSHTICARTLGKEACILPAANVLEGAMVSGIKCFGFQTLREVIDFLLGIQWKEPAERPEKAEEPDDVTGAEPDFSEIYGQYKVKRAAEIAASGMHAMLLMGPPGSGKTMTARRIPSILPPLTERESIESSRIHSVSGILDHQKGLLTTRPFRSPHHSITAAALLGGGTVPRPGEMSLAHNGVLFLDEMTEFNRQLLDNMRTALEDGEVSIARVNGTYVFPTRVMLVGALNLCPCGLYPGSGCHCSEYEIRHYLGRISKPLLDRIDICTEVKAVSASELLERTASESSEEIRKRVIRAWEIQKERYKDLKIVFNSELRGKQITKYCYLGKEEKNLMSDIDRKLGLSARAHDKVLKVARTLADLSLEERISGAHLSEAVIHREAAVKYWGN